MYGVMVKNATALHGHLRGIIQVFDEVKTDFKAMSAFGNIEAEFSASLVVKLQNEVTTV